jgi:N6-L-threonylcarbamoyladenine synthase
MEGHIVSTLISNDFTNQKLEFPALALLISGGHTELVLINEWQKYKILGQTRDDAVGEAFDKVARMMGLPYPGGPEISKMAEVARAEQIKSELSLPRPMIGSKDYNFSFSGLKTAVLYAIKKMTNEEKNSPNWKQKMAREFEDAITEVLISKTRRALEEYSVKTLIVSGGVIANQHIRQEFEQLKKGLPDTKFLLPETSLSTDNAVMIAVAGYFNSLSGMKLDKELHARGNLTLGPDL